MNSELVPIYPWQRDLWQKLAKDRTLLPNALMLSGQAGMGKTVFALHLARLLLCFSPQNKNKDKDKNGDEVLSACGACHSCSLFASRTHPDLLHIDGSASSSVKGGILLSDVHGLRNFLQRTSHLGQAKAVVVTAAETMNRAAANALLKILEEPPPQKYLILVTAAAARLPATVCSRCVFIHMHSLTADELTAWLAGLTEAIRPDAFLCGLCGNAPLAARELLTSERGKILVRINKTLEVLEEGNVNTQQFIAACLTGLKHRTDPIRAEDPLNLLIWRLENRVLGGAPVSQDTPFYRLWKIFLARRRLLLTGINLKQGTSLRGVCNLVATRYAKKGMKKPGEMEINPFPTTQQFFARILQPVLGMHRD